MIEILNAKSSGRGAADVKLVPQETWLSHWQEFMRKPQAEFVRLVEDSANLRPVVEVAERIDCRRILIVGVGGSSLGTQMIQTALAGDTQREFIYLEAPDPSQWCQIRNRIDGTEHVIVISKSGGTLETLTWVEQLRAVQPRLFTAEQCTVIASPGTGALQTWAKENKIPCLWIPEKVGGRFSVLSAVGMLPAALMGLNVKEFYAGAVWAIKHPEIAARLSAEAAASWERDETITQLWSFAGGLKPFGEWWQQLWSESLGKKETLIASSPVACIGPRDQHSLVQQLLEGDHNKYVYVTRVSDLEKNSDTFKAAMFPALPYAGREASLGLVLGAQARAFEQSLCEVGIHHVTVQLDKLNEQSLAALVMVWQMTIAMLGEHLKINAFDQPGVELGKRYAQALLRG